MWARASRLHMTRPSSPCSRAGPARPVTIAVDVPAGAHGATALAGLLTSQSTTIGKVVTGARVAAGATTPSSSTSTSSSPTGA
jgi:hypothetical protein